MTVLTFECLLDETKYLIGKADFAPHKIHYTHHKERKDITVAGDIFPHESTPLNTVQGLINKIEFEIYDGTVRFIFYTVTGGWSYQELNLSWSSEQLKLFNDNINRVLDEYTLLPVSIDDVRTEL